MVQQYHNPFDGKIEAVYVFPLPQNAAVSEFVMVIGERRIRGIVRDRKEAEEIYEAAKTQGASDVHQDRLLGCAPSGVECTADVIVVPLPAKEGQGEVFEEEQAPSVPHW